MGMSSKIRAPSGVTQAWRLWRHCCCRSGWYPFFVAPFVTASCILSVYSSTDCEFMQVNVGFAPQNEAWNQSVIDLGFISYQSGESDDNKYRAYLVDGCREYTDEFESFFIDEDRTWMIARVMAAIAAISGLTATVTIWLLTITPLPASFFWPGVLLPSVLIAFLTEGAKFLIFDAQICSSRLWEPYGDDYTPRRADSCILGRSGKFSIAAGATYFFCLLLVFLKAPEKRELVPHYGKYYDNMGDTEELRTGDMLDSADITTELEQPRVEAGAAVIVSNKSNPRSSSRSMSWDDIHTDFSKKARQSDKAGDENDDRYNPTKPARLSTRTGKNSDEAYNPQKEGQRSSPLKKSVSSEHDVNEEIGMTDEDEQSHGMVGLGYAVPTKKHDVKDKQEERIDALASNRDVSDKRDDSPKREIAEEKKSGEKKSPSPVKPGPTKVPPSDEELGLNKKRATICKIPESSNNDENGEECVAEGQSPKDVIPGTRTEAVGDASDKEVIVSDLRRTEMDKTDVGTTGSAEELIDKCVTELKKSFAESNEKSRENGEKTRSALYKVY